MSDEEFLPELPDLPPSMAARLLSRDRHVLNRRERLQRWWRGVTWDAKVLQAKYRNARIEWPTAFRQWVRHPKLSRVFLRRVWIMFGPEVLIDSSEPSKQFERVWLRQIHVPYYEGSGRSFRFGNWTLRIGFCRPKVSSPLMPWLFPERRGLYVLDTSVDFDAELGYALGRTLSKSAQEVRSWGSSSPSETATSEPTTTSMHPSLD